MPGVFTSRGCVACRKQKKRCQAEDDVPPCTRCKRLDIPCVGFGVRRFKFRDESEKVIAIHGDKNSEEDRSSTSSGNAAVSLRSRKDKKDDFRVIVFNAPSSVLTRLIAAYVRGIDPKADIAFQLPWNFGPFLEDVPRYLGAHESLDVAADAVVAAYTCLRTGRRAAVDQYSLRKYSKALRALANALAEPRTATAAETLCATKMLMIFEAIAGFASKGQIAHAGGAARIFKARGFRKPETELEMKLALSLRGPVVVQSLFLTHSYFTAEEWMAITYSEHGDSGSPEEQSFRCFGLYARLLQRARQLLAAQMSSEHVLDLEFDSLEEVANNLRLTHAPFLETLRERFWSLNGALHAGREAIAATVAQSAGLSPSVEGNNVDWSMKVMHAHIARSYGIGLGCQVLINALLLALRAQHTKASEALPEARHCKQPGFGRMNRALEIDNALMARESCRLATAVNLHRPLGTLYVGLMLRTTYVGANDVILDGADDDWINNCTSGTRQGSPGDLIGLLSQNTGGSPQLPQSHHFPLISGANVEAEIRQLLRSYVSDFEAPGEESEAEADIRCAGELDWLRDLFTLKLEEPTFAEQASQRRHKTDKRQHGPAAEA